jgi:hypothetical protein
MKQLITILFIFFAANTCFAKDTVIVHKDLRLDIFTEKQSEVNKRTSGMIGTGLYKGYRIQVLSTRHREDAFELKTQLLKMFPSQQTYVVYQSPYFKVRVGNFLHKSDAESFKNILSRSYKQNAYVVEDVIEYTPKENENSTSVN